MEYIIHLTVPQLQDIVDASVRKQTQPLVDAIKSLSEQKDNELLKIEDAMRILKISRKTCTNWVKQKKLRCHWLGGKLYFRMKDIHESLESNF